MRSRCGEQAIDVVGWRLWKSMRNDHAIGIATEPVTGRAIDVEAFAAAREQRGRRFRWRRLDWAQSDVALSHNTVRQRACGSTVGPKPGGRIRLVLALLPHAEAAAGQQQH